MRPAPASTRLRCRRHPEEGSVPRGPGYLPATSANFVAARARSRKAWEVHLAYDVSGVQREERVVLLADRDDFRFQVAIAAPMDRLESSLLPEAATSSARQLRRAVRRQIAAVRSNCRLAADRAVARLARAAVATDRQARAAVHAGASRGPIVSFPSTTRRSEFSLSTIHASSAVNSLSALGSSDAPACGSVRSSAGLMQSHHTAHGHRTSVQIPSSRRSLVDRCLCRSR